VWSSIACSRVDGTGMVDIPIIITPIIIHQIIIHQTICMVRAFGRRDCGRKGTKISRNFAALSEKFSVV
jgi:hypothetical protein